MVPVLFPISVEKTLLRQDSRNQVVLHNVSYLFHEVCHSSIEGIEVGGIEELLGYQFVTDYRPITLLCS